MDKYVVMMNSVHCDKCREGMYENEYLDSARDIFDQF